MKFKKEVLQGLGLVAGLGLCASVYVIYEHKRKDRLASQLLQELNKLLNPTATGLSSEEAFDINYAEEVIKKVKNVLVIKVDAARRFAKEIYNAWGIDDDEDKIYSVFRSMKDKVQVSQVAKAYLDDYKINLIDKMKSKLTDSEVGQILKIVNSLPRYRTV